MNEYRTPWDEWPLLKYHEIISSCCSVSSKRHLCGIPIRICIHGIIAHRFSHRNYKQERIAEQERIGTWGGIRSFAQQPSDASSASILINDNLISAPIPMGAGHVRGRS